MAAELDSKKRKLFTSVMKAITVLEFLLIHKNAQL